MSTNTIAARYIVITGNPVDGLQFIGPFEVYEDAIFAGELFDADWWIAPLTALDEDAGNALPSHPATP